MAAVGRPPESYGCMEPSDVQCRNKWTTSSQHISATKPWSGCCAVLRLLSLGYMIFVPLKFVVPSGRIALIRRSRKALFLHNLARSISLLILDSLNCKFIFRVFLQFCNLLAFVHIDRLRFNHKVPRSVTDHAISERWAEFPYDLLFCFVIRPVKFYSAGKRKIRHLPASDERRRPQSMFVFLCWRNTSP